MDYPHAMDGINSEYEICDVYLCKALLKVNFLGEELSETTAAAII